MDVPKSIESTTPYGITYDKTTADTWITEREDSSSDLKPEALLAVNRNVWAYHGCIHPWGIQASKARKQRTSTG
ncbi:uncharacterized protein V6R79_014813 [Siganus canaliculatus]